MIALPQLLRLAVLVHQESPSACLMAHASPASSVDDCRKSQTSAATPAEPGDLPWGLGFGSLTGWAAPFAAADLLQSQRRVRRCSARRVCGASTGTNASGL